MWLHYRGIIREIKIFRFLTTSGWVISVFVALTACFLTLAFWIWGSKYFPRMSDYWIILAALVPFVINLALVGFFRWRTRGYWMIDYTVEQTDFSIRALIFSESYKRKIDIADDWRVVATSEIDRCGSDEKASLLISHTVVASGRQRKIKVGGLQYFVMLEARVEFVNLPETLKEVLAQGDPWWPWQVAWKQKIKERLEALAETLDQLSPISRGDLEPRLASMAKQFGGEIERDDAYPVRLRLFMLHLEPCRVPGGFTVSYDPDLQRAGADSTAE